MSDETPYIKRDLIDYADLDRFYGGETYGPSDRTNALRNVLPDDAIVKRAGVGSYQGSLAMVIVCNGHLWIHLDNYGSCSLCDPFLADKLQWTKKMLREAYCFEHVDDAKQYLEETDDWGWSSEERLRSKTLDLLEEVSRRLPRKAREGNTTRTCLECGAETVVSVHLDNAIENGDDIEGVVCGDCAGSGDPLIWSDDDG